MARVAVVTGASSGIGEATARLLAGAGWRCVLVARREERLLALADEIGGEVELCDVADRDAVDAMAARILERHPAVNLLVNNAGMPARGTFLAVDPDLVRRVVEVNYLGGVWCTRALLPGLRWAASAGGQAHVVNLVFRRRNDRVRACGRVRGVEARAAGVFPLSGLRARRKRDRRPYGATGVRRDRGLPAERRPQEPASRPLRDPAATGRGGGRRGGGEGAARGDRPVVPVPPRSRSCRRCSPGWSPASPACPTTAPARSRGRLERPRCRPSLPSGR